MVNYRRDITPGACYFLTWTLQNRKANYLTNHIEILKKSYNKAKQRYPFKTLAYVILPDHIHVIWKMPPDSCHYSKGIQLIKSQFTRSLVKEGVPLKKNHRGEYNLWQNRFWEHLIRDEADFQQHIKYIHYNPVKHNLVEKTQDWSFSSVHAFIQSGRFDA